jgi:hypothetical protein
MKKSKTQIALIAAFAAGIHMASAGVLAFPLGVDAGNSSTAYFGSALINTINDPFAYDPANPNSPGPNQSWASSRGYHALEPAGTDVFLTYTFDEVTLPVNHQLVVDMWGRFDCCQNRDDNFDIEVYDGGLGGTLLGTQVGLGIPNTAPYHARANIGAFSFLPPRSTFDTIRIVAHDSDGLGNANAFTFMEFRAGYVGGVPEPATTMYGMLGVCVIAGYRKLKRNNRIRRTMAANA